MKWVVRNNLMPKRGGPGQRHEFPVYYNGFLHAWDMLFNATLYDVKEDAETMGFWLVTQDPGMAGNVEVCEANEREIEAAKNFTLKKEDLESF